MSSGSRRDRRAELVKIKGPVGWLKAHRFENAAGQFGCRRVGIVERFEGDQLVTRADERLNRIEDHFGGAAGDGDLAIRVDLAAETRTANRERLRGGVVDGRARPRID